MERYGDEAHQLKGFSLKHLKRYRSIIDDNVIMKMFLLFG